MRLINLLSASWMITPAVYADIRSLINTHLQGEKLDLKQMETRLLSSGDLSSDNDYEVIGETAVINISGILMKNAGLFEKIILGAISTSDIKSQIEEILANDQIKRIILRIDSPGGTVDGTKELADFIYNSRSIKEIISITDGVMASAAYWIGSTASKIYITNSTVTVGSIGVLTTHYDQSKRNEMMGVLPTEVFAGKYKVIGSQTKPLSKDGKEFLQGRVDYLYSIFVDSVAQNRNRSSEEVLSSMADGRLFIGQEAIDAGLVDGISTLESILSDKLNFKNTDSGAAGIAVQSEKPKEELMPITIESLLKEAPEVHKAVFDKGKEEARKEAEAEFNAKVKSSVEAETLRIKSVFEQSRSGYEEIIKEKAFDGKSTAGDAAIAINQAEKEAQAKALAAMEGHSPQAQPQGSTDPAGNQQNTAKTPEEKIKAEWDANAEVRADYGNDFEAFTAFKKAEADGRIGIIKDRG